MDTNRDPTALTQQFGPNDPANPVTNRPGVGGFASRTSGGTYTEASVAVEWSRTDPTDYLAGGYWLYVDGNTHQAELGAFIDGPAFENLTQSLPVTGTATYDGRAGGIYVASAGSDALSPGALEQGEYEASTQLTANFGTMRIAGTIDNVSLYNIVGITATGQGFTSPDQRVPYVLSLQSAPLNSNGTFVGDQLSMSHPDLNITATTGSWAGRFSNVNDADGNPRAVAGTNAVSFETAGGSQALFTGAFYGATERFE